MADDLGAIGTPTGFRNRQGAAVRWFTARRRTPRRRSESLDSPSVRSTRVKRVLRYATERYTGMAQWAAMLVAIALAYKLAELTWLIVAYAQPAAAAPHLLVSSEPAPHAQKTASTPAARDLASLHLFGQVPSSETVAVIEPAVTPTRLSLVLRGTIASADSGLARALIANDRGEEHSFAADELMFGETRLETIHPHHVVIRRGDRRELLHFPRDSAGSDVEGAGVNLEAIAQTETETEYGPRVLTPVREVRDADSLREFRQYVADHPHALAALTEKPAETDSNGRVIGYRLDNVTTAGHLRQLGLRPGDVLTAINDVPMGDTRNLAPLVAAVAGMKEIQIHYIRRGQPRVIALGAF